MNIKMRHYVQWTTVFINKKTKLNCSFYFLASDRGWNEALMRIFLYIFEKRWFKVEQWEDHLIQKIRSKGCTCRKKWHELCDLDLLGQFGVFNVNPCAFMADGFILNVIRSDTYMYYTS